MPSIDSVSVVVVLPERAATASYPTRRRPQARVEISCGEERRTLYIPTRVARSLKADDLEGLGSLDAVTRAVDGESERVCYAVLVDALSRRDHSSHEVRDKLMSHGFKPSHIDAAIARAIDQRFLDDERFARYFIEERKRRGWGRFKIEQELKRKGVDPREVPGYPEEFFSVDDDSERIQGLLAKKPVPESRPYEKLVRFLMGKGYSYAAASEAVREHLDAVDARSSMQ